MHLPELISDLAIMLLTAGVVTVIFKKIKQPLVLGYIVAGFLIGPYMPFSSPLRTARPSAPGARLAL